MSVNTCDRCDRDLKDPNAKYGWRCEKLMGGGGIYQKARSPTKAPVYRKMSSAAMKASDIDGGTQVYIEPEADPSLDKYLAIIEKYTLFVTVFQAEAFLIAARNSGGSIWNIPEYYAQIKGTLSMLEALFTGEITPADVIVSMMENAVEGIAGDLYFVVTHLDWYHPDTELTKAETIELAKRTAGAWEEGAQLTMILYGALKGALTRKAGGTVAGKFKSTPELEAHIKYVDPSVPRKRGIGGAHNSVEFFKNDIQIVSRTPHPTVKGVEIVKYQMPKLDKAGNPIPGVYQSGKPLEKTIYDPKIISDELYISRGIEAANNALSKTRNGVLPREWTGVDNHGVKWEGYIENGKITSFYPQ